MSHLLEWARRRATATPTSTLLDDLRSGATTERAAAERGLPAVAVEGVRSFYDLLHGPTGPRACSGTACRFAGGHELAASAGADPTAPAARVHCLGRCYDPPASTDREAPPIPRACLAPEPVVLRHLLPGCEPELDRDFDLPSGDAILAAIEASGLRGRGGAAYPTAAKWRVAKETPALDRYVVANGDEGDPGSYVDRLLLEEDPHAVLAGMLACARAIGARRGVVFIRGEYPKARAAVEAAIRDATSRGHLGEFFDVSVVAGAGSYVAGEETALLRAIEGLRAEPSPKPPYPAEHGLHGLPTVVQNVETLAVVPWVVRSRRRTNTKAICLSGAVARPAVVEVALGTPLSRVLRDAGGGPPPGQRWSMALVGGPMGRVLPVSEFDTPLSFDALPGMGHGGVVVLDDSVSPRALAEHLFEFAANESCGSCAPCRIGSVRLAAMRDRGSLERLFETMELGSLCGFGQGVPRPLRDLLRHFGDAVFAC